MRRRRATLLTLFLLAALVGGTGIWLRSAQHQYTLNSHLTAALVHSDDKQALALVNAGADPNAWYPPTPVPSLLQLVKQVLHCSPSPVIHNTTALLVACRPEWDDPYDFVSRFYSTKPDWPDNAPLVQAMLTHGATVNAQDQEEHGATPLLWSVFSHRAITVKVLLEHGASVDATDDYGRTPLILAARCDVAPDLMHLLLVHGANVNAQEKYGQTPVMVAVIFSPNLVRLLLENGARVNMQDNQGFTALLWAMWRSAHKDVIRQLLQHGADPSLADKYGHTPLMLAQQHQHPDIVALLKQAGARR